MSEQFPGETRQQKLLTCPSCQNHFEYRNFPRSRACPSCETSLRFSIPYLAGLGTFALIVFLYCSYRVLLSSGFLLPVVWLILAAPLAVLARLFFVVNIFPDLYAIGVAKCPICDGTLTRLNIRLVPFDCPHCLKQIRIVRRPSCRWARVAICATYAVTMAELKGFDWTLLIFVVSAFAFPALICWDIFALDFFPPMRFEATKSSVQMLDISRS